MIRQLLRSWWEGLKELSQPGGCERRYARYHKQITGSPQPQKAPTPKRPSAQPQPTHQKHKKLTLKKVNRGLSRMTRSIKRLNKPHRAPGKRGLKY